jgi:hypothetical protein
MSDALHIEDFGPAPLDVPSIYPGKWPTKDFLMVGKSLWDMKAKPGRRLEQSLIDNSGHADAGKHFSTLPIPLSYTLLHLNATPMTKRRPFLSVGSNANPAQLHKKFSDAQVSLVVPITVAAVKGLSIGFSNHVAFKKYVPTSAELLSDASGKFVITWLDEIQARSLNQTEGSYALKIYGEKQGVRVQLASGEKLDRVVAYVSRYGLRSDETGVIHLADTNDGRIRQQLELMSAPFSEGVLARELSSDEWLESNLLYGKQGGFGAVSTVRAETAFTAVGKSDSIPTDTESATIIRSMVLPTPGDTVHQGDSVAIFNEADYETLKRPSRAWVRPFFENVEITIPGVVVAAQSSSQVPQGCIYLDQIPRNAIGIELREQVSVSAVESERVSLGGLVAKHPVYAFCRVQPATLVAMERDIVLMDPLAMDVIGVESGDRIRIEGVPTEPGGKLPRLYMRVVAATDAALSERRELTGGGMESRYPSARDALGVYPDLAWAFLDQSAREKLNLGDSKVATLRIRASRKDLLFKEARELMLLVVLAAIGLLAVIKDYRLAVASVVAVVIIGTLLVVSRLRRKVSKATG